MLRAAVIGAGWFAAQNHIPVLARRPDVTLDGVCRLGADELERVRSHFGFAFAAEDFRDVLARKPDIVVVASPHDLHHEHARAALEAGAHVLVEKPMTLRPEDAWDLVAMAQRAGRHLLVANGYHYLPNVETVRATVPHVGCIEHVSCVFASATRPVFSGSVGFRRWRTTFFRPDIATWQAPERGGGFAYGQLSHSVALMLWLTGLYPERVAAVSYGESAIDLHDAAALRFRGGAIASIAGAAAVPEGEQARLRLAITGEAGTLEFDVDLGRCRLALHDGTLATVPAPDGGWRYDCEGPVEALVELAQGRGDNRSPGEIGALTVEVIAAMLQSARSDGAAIRCQR
ncbi:MAG: Gfo/Idh/MocA family oxidoreductase [Acetobacteraceae bacterium]|nr:Gfo/Idh/MocA family oxidoreductase [Acetobacteraceae bacterium]